MTTNLRSGAPAALLAGGGSPQPRRTRLLEQSSWVPLIISEARVIDIDADELTLRFRVAPMPNPEWEGLFEQSTDRQSAGTARSLLTFTDPAIIAGIVTCKVDIAAIGDARSEMRRLVDETNASFVALLEHRALVSARQLELARQRRHALAEAQRLLDDPAAGA